MYWWLNGRQQAACNSSALAMELLSLALCHQCMYMALVLCLYKCTSCSYQLMACCGLGAALMCSITTLWNHYWRCRRMRWSRCSVTHHWLRFTLNLGQLSWMRVWKPNALTGKVCRVLVSSLIEYLAIFSQVRTLPSVMDVKCICWTHWSLGDSVKF